MHAETLQDTARCLSGPRRLARETITPLQGVRSGELPCVSRARDEVVTLGMAPALVQSQAHGAAARGAEEPQREQGWRRHRAPCVCVQGGNAGRTQICSEILSLPPACFGVEGWVQRVTGAWR